MQVHPIPLNAAVTAATIVVAIDDLLLQFFLDPAAIAQAQPLTETVERAVRKVLAA